MPNEHVLQGTFRYKDCTYEGQWADMKRNGRGVLRWDSGDVFEGLWKDDKRTGNGRCDFADGGFHEGAFLNGKRNGHGLRFYAVDGKSDPQYGDITWSAGDRMKCSFKDDKRHGACTYTFFNGETFECSWIDGKCPEFTARQRAVLVAPDRESALVRAAADAAAAEAKAAAEATAAAEAKAAAEAAAASEATAAAEFENDHIQITHVCNTCEHACSNYIRACECSKICNNMGATFLFY